MILLMHRPILLQSPYQVALEMTFSWGEAGITRSMEEQAMTLWCLEAGLTVLLVEMAMTVLLEGREMTQCLEAVGTMCSWSPMWAM